MNPSYTNSPSPSQPPVFSSGSAPVPPTPSGNIALSSAPSKKSKKPLIFAIIGGVIIIIVAIVAVNIFQSQSAAKAKITEALEFIKNGDSSIDYSFKNPTDEDLQLKDSIAAIAVSEAGNVAEITAYYKALASKTSDLGSSDSAQEMIDLAQILNRSINYQQNLKEIKEYYSKNGYDKTINYIQSLKITSDNSVIQTFSNQYVQYYEQSITEYNLFNINQCLDGDLYNYECAENLGITSEIQSAEAKSNSALNFLTDTKYLELLDDAIQQQLKEIEERIK